MQLTAEHVKRLLREGEVEILGLLPGASNYTFAATVADAELKLVAVYKPQAGETPCSSAPVTPRSTWCSRWMPRDTTGRSWRFLGAG